MDSSVSGLYRDVLDNMSGSQFPCIRITGLRVGVITVYKLDSGGIVAVYRDLTEQKQLVKALVISVEKYRFVY